MSYILDALQRSDNERAVENIPTLHSDRRARGRRSRRIDSTWIALLAIVAIVGFTAYWYRATIMEVATRYVPALDSAGTTPVAANAPPAAPPPETAPAPVQPQQPVAAPQPASPSISNAVRQASQAPPPAPVASQTGALEQVPQAQPVAQPQPAPQPVVQQQPAGANEVEDADDLPPAMRQKMPTMSLNVVSYSKNEDRRFVMIDQKIFREGDSVPGGMTIEEITEDGPIMRWQGRQFLMRP